MARSIQSSATIQVEGLDELTANLKTMNKRLARLLTKAGKKAATDFASAAQGAVPHRSGRMAGSIKPSATAKGAKISLGGAGAPHAVVNEFGGSIPTRGNAGGKLMRHRELLTQSGITTSKHKTAAALGLTSQKTRALRTSKSGRYEFKPWARSGYFVFPALKEAKPDIEKTYREEVGEVLREAGLR